MSTYTIASLTEDVFNSAVGDQTGHRLTVWGAQISELVTDFKGKLAAAVAGEDFTDILSPDCSFIV